jgi:uncharacterized protein YjbI with pentapeptide repeats
MPNEEQLNILRQGVSIWNAWRLEHPKEWIDLTGADLRGANLTQADLSGTYLTQADLSGAYLKWAQLSWADLSGAHLRQANLSEAYLKGAHLIQADLRWADLRMADITEADLRIAKLFEADLSQAYLMEADLRLANLRLANLRLANLSGANLSQAKLDGATLTDANLSEAILIRTNLQDAKLNNCRIYGIAAWDLNLAGAEQSNLIITPNGAPTITVDNLEVAQFIYLLLYNEKIRHVIDTITSKVVLILGRFTPERKAVLDAIRDELRRHDFLPVLFDFQKPESRDFTETVSTLAHMARFVIADLTDAKIVLEEVTHIVPSLAVPLIPLLLEGEEEPVTLLHLRRISRCVLPTCRYTDREELLASLEEKVIVPAQAKALELREIR